MKHVNACSRFFVSERCMTLRIGCTIAFLYAAGCIAQVVVGFVAGGMTMAQAQQTIDLPKPRHDSGYGVEQTLRQRRSIREFSRSPLTLAEVSQLLWAAQGITHREGLRTAPSAGALYPLEVYLLLGNVDELDPGIYKYRPDGHQLVLLGTDDRRGKLARAAYHQTWLKHSAAILVFAAVEQRTTRKYGRRGRRYIYIEVGHAAQNVFLQAVALQLGAGVVGAFDDEAVQSLMGMPKNEHPLYLMPVGRMKSR